MSGSEVNKTLCGMVTVLWFFRSLGPKLAEGSECIGICDSSTGKCWGFIFVESVAVKSEFKCLIKIQLNSDVLKNFR